MKRTILLSSGLAVLIHVTGCDRHAPNAPAGAATSASANSTPSPSLAPSAPAPSGVPSSPAAEESPFPGLPPRPDAAVKDPQAMIAWWRQALETHHFKEARKAWGDNGEASGQSEAAFTAAWDKYRIIDITPGKGEVEGAAGSSYYEVPVTVTGLRRDGKPYNLAGTVTLRRVNDIDGASAEQLRWHIERSTLKP